ncbi:MAG: PHP domain-containing protein [Clostridia bacterium]|nr:PHP domain-containing protein [Clostridia bacterium]
MNRYTYDLHIHSALSPCGDNEMSPNNIAGFLSLAGIAIGALTDHNTCANCPAFFEACKRYGVVPVGGMELTTAEEIHIVCLFPTLEAALEFDETVKKRRMKIENRAEIFGEQLVFDGEDRVIGSDPWYLPAATDISLMEVPALVKRHGGICYPAHIDRPSGGLPAILGGFPPEIQFGCYELHDQDKKQEYLERFPHLGALTQLCCSDAHSLLQIKDGEHSLLLDDEPYSSALLRISLIKKLAKPQGAL